MDNVPLEHQIVVADELDFSEQDLAGLRSLGDLTVYPDIPEREELVARLRDATVAIAGWSTFDSEILDQLPRLKHIALALTALDPVDLVHAAGLGISVSYVPGYSTQSVAEYAYGLALALIRRICLADAQVRSGDATAPGPSLKGFELYGKTLGVIGLGRIGQHVARIGNGFGMRVVGCSRSPKGLAFAEDQSVDGVVSESDLVVITVDINDASKGMLSAQRIASLKTGAVLVNITSNQVLDEEALAARLREGSLGGAAFDDITRTGYDDERRGVESPFVGLDNVLVSPQAGWYTVDAERRLMRTVVDNVRGFIGGHPQNLAS